MSDKTLTTIEISTDTLLSGASGVDVAMFIEEEE